MINTLREQFEIPQSVSIVPGRNEMPVVHLTHGSGSSAKIYLYGAHITSWKNGVGDEMFFLSREAIFEPGKAIRGGIPVIFPQFGGNGPLPSHGIARVANWALTRTGLGASGEVEVVLTLTDTPESLKLWPHRFQMDLEMRLMEDALSVGIRVKNTDDKPFSFQTALHTYFAIGDIHQTAVTGLKGVEYIDSLRSSARETETRDEIRFDQETDRIYVHTPDQVKIEDELNSRQFDITKENMPDIVVWNPWIEKSKRLADYGDDEYLRMVCVETGVITEPKELAAGAEYNGKTTFAFSYR